jgi:archaellum component FlaF (FlaF/FlaG flagellin family)
MLTTSLFNTPARADRWLITPSFSVNNANMIMSWTDQEGISGEVDSVQVWVSPTGGTTAASFTQKIYDGPATAYNDAGNFGQKGASLGTYNGQTIRVAFRNNSYDQGTLRIDNVGTQIMPNSLDGQLNQVTFKKIVAATSSNPVIITVTNQGATNINAIEASYKVDNGTPVTQVFNNVNLSPLSSTTLTFTTPIANPSVGAHTITTNILQVNAVADPVASNNQATTNFAVATGTAPRKALIEEYTSSTCAPCASFNQVFDPLILTNNANVPSSNFNVIKYQMNWPTPNNDASYNPDGNSRKSYYGVNAIPDHYTNGKLGGAGNQAEINAAKAEPAYLSLSGSYTIKGDSLIAVVTVTPNFTLTGGNYSLFMAATEYSYHNPNNTTGQEYYYHVMRKMLPDGTGLPMTTFTAGTPVTFERKFKYEIGNVTQGSYKFWWHPYAGNLVAFVQDNNSKEVLNSVSIPAQWPTAIKDVPGGIGNIRVYPNPAREGANLDFSLDKATSVNISVIDALGRVLYVTSEKMSQGTQHVYLPTAKFAAGTYQVNIQSEEGSITERLTVIK